MGFLSVLLSVSALLLSITLLVGGNSLQFVILGLRAESEGFSLAALGALTTAYYTGYALGSIYAPRFVGQFGHIRAFAALVSLTSAIVIAHGLFVEPTWWLLLRFLTGLCFAGIATVSESWINARTTVSHRGRLLAVYTALGTAGYAAGPLFANLAPVDELTLFALASILMSLALVPVTLTRYAAPSLPPPETPEDSYGPLRLARETPLGVAGVFFGGAIQGAFLGLGAVFATRMGLDVAGASLFVTAALVIGALAQWPAGLLSDLMDRRFVLVGLALTLGAGAFIVAGLLELDPLGTLTLGLAALVAGCGAMLIYPIATAYVNDRIPESSIVPAAATLILSFAAGSAITAPIASASMDAMGPAGLYYFNGTLLLAFGAFGLFRMTVREAPEPAEGADAIFAPPVLAPIDFTAEVVADDDADAGHDATVDDEATAVESGERMASGEITEPSLVSAQSSETTPP